MLEWGEGGGFIACHVAGKKKQKLEGKKKTLCPEDFPWENFYSVVKLQTPTINTEHLAENFTISTIKNNILLSTIVQCHV